MGGAVRPHGWMGEDEAVVGRWVVIRAIRVIRLIRDSDTAARLGTHAPYSFALALTTRSSLWMSRQSTRILPCVSVVTTISPAVDRNAMP